MKLPSDHSTHCHQRCTVIIHRLLLSSQASVNPEIGLVRLGSMTLLLGVRTSSLMTLSWLVCLVPLQATRFVYLISCQTRLVLAEEEIQLVDFTQLFTGSVAVNCSLFHALLCPLHGPRPCDRYIQQTSFTSGFSCFPFHQAGLKKSKPIGSLLLLMMFYCDVNIDRLPPPPPLLFSFWAALLILLCSVLIFTLDQLIYNFHPPFSPPHTHTHILFDSSRFGLNSANFGTAFRQEASSSIPAQAASFYTDCADVGIVLVSESIRKIV